jgi:GTP-binding protein HflX
LARRISSAHGPRDRNSGVPGALERAFLVGLELHARRGQLPQAQAAREAAALQRNQRQDVSTAAETSSNEIASRFSTEEAMNEFRELATSAGAEVVGEFLQRRDRPDPATLIGKGKLQELNGAAASADADVILFDHDLTPSQQRNIEREVGVRVIDRTQLILDIFARHARTREGQLQVELAQLEYMLPRLTGRGVEMSQLGGGIGTRGPGETQLELDRRRIYRRIRHLQHQLESVRRIRAQQRQRRESVPVETVALVGYTNAGKSTLFNALTKAGVLESSRLFATLDPTLRGITLPSRRKVLLSDTVGFIRNLPHTLVTSFRATLEEVQRASLILHVSDASSPHVQEQQLQVEKVLEELQAKDKPTIRIYNKIDLVSPERAESFAQMKGAVAVSAVHGTGLEELLKLIDDRLIADRLMRAHLLIPQAEGKVLAMLEANSRILTRDYRDSFVSLTVEAPESLLKRLLRFRPEELRAEAAENSGKKPSKTRVG